MGSSNQKEKKMLNIDFDLVEFGFRTIAKTFRCVVCNKIPLNPVQCFNPDCEKFICYECHLIPQRCLACKELMPKIVAPLGVSKILKLIKVKCPNKCGAVDDLDLISIHFMECIQIRPTKPAGSYLKEMQFINKKTRRPDYDDDDRLIKSNLPNQKQLKFKEIKLNNFDQEEYSIFEDSEFLNFKRNIILKGSLQEKDLENDLMIMKCEKELLQILPDEQIKHIVMTKNITLKESKEEMIHSIVGYFKVLKLENSHIKKKLENNDKINDSELDNFLNYRKIPTEGSREEKIELLKEYIKKAV